MNRKKFLRIVLVLTGVVILLFGILVFHIAQVTNPKNKPHYGIQLSRIDFDYALDSATAIEVCNYIKSIDGVGNAMYSYEFHNIVFSHDLNKVKGRTVYDALMNTKQLDAQLYVVNAEDAAKNAKCPVVNNKGILMSLAHKIQIYLL
ncbi:MAG: hypothetical protein WC716_13425 [Chitinophagaceae bacterium]|jgi:hypothetical protein